MKLMKNIIEEKLKKQFSPEFLIVVDNSHLHAGHSGSKPSGQTHFAIKIKSSQFEGLSKIAIHRQINNLLNEEFLNGMHALEIEIIS